MIRGLSFSLFLWRYQEKVTAFNVPNKNSSVSSTKGGIMKDVRRSSYELKRYELHTVESPKSKVA